MQIKKRAMTLLEIMIVIFIIGIIGSVVGYNMKGSLEKGKAFKTEHGMRQVEEIIMLEVASGNVQLDEVDNIEKVQKILKNSDLARNAKDLIKDGWGKEYEVRKNKYGNKIRLVSAEYNSYKDKQNKKKPKK